MLRSTRTAEMARGLLSRHGEVMPTRTTPEDGDIVVREELRGETPVYVLHIAPGADRCLLRTSDEAVAQALVFAKRGHVRLWLTDEGYDFVLFEDFREVALSDSLS